MVTFIYSSTHCVVYRKLTAITSTPIAHGCVLFCMKTEHATVQELFSLEMHTNHRLTCILYAPTVEGSSRVMDSSNRVTPSEI